MLLFIFYRKKAFQNLWKLVFLSSKKLFWFLRYWIFRQFFLFLSTVSRFKRSDHKANLSKHVLKLKERLVTSSTLLLFMILSINGDWAQRKNQVNFFMVSFEISSIWSLSKFQPSFAYIGCFGLFNEIKKGYGTSFQWKFSVFFFHKYVPY